MKSRFVITPWSWSIQSWPFFLLLTSLNWRDEMQQLITRIPGSSGTGFLFGFSRRTSKKRNDELVPERHHDAAPTARKAHCHCSLFLTSFLLTSLRYKLYTRLPVFFFWARWFNVILNMHHYKLFIPVNVPAAPWRDENFFFSSMVCVYNIGKETKLSKSPWK